MINTLATDGKIDLTPPEPEPRRQLDISRYLAKEEGDEAEAVVVDVLVKHYNETGQKFVYFGGTKDSPDWYSVAEHFDLDVESVKEAIAKLNQEKRVMKYPDRSIGKWKIGLYKGFVAMLEAV